MNPMKFYPIFKNLYYLKSRIFEYSMLKKLITKETEL